VLPEREGKRFADVMRPVGLALRCGDRMGLIQWIMVGPKPRSAAVTLRPPAGGGGCRIAILAGWGVGPVRVAAVRLREGCAEVFARRFQHGLALANGSAADPFTFDLRKIGAGRRYRRFAGFQAADVNNGLPVGEQVTVPPMDGILLMVR